MIAARAKKEIPVDTTHSFDYVVVGGGSAGAAVAARLSEDPTVTVGLLEAGPTDVDEDVILRLNRWMELLESGFDWDYPIEKQEHGNSFMRHARAKVLGGRSSHNSCIAFWAPKEDLDEWETKYGATGWGSKDTFGLYKKLENNELPGDHHGHDGPVRLMNVPPVDPCGIALLEACEQAGIPTVQFNEGETVINGANFFQVNRKDDGTRSSSSVSYLHPILDSENLTILTDTQAKEIEFDDENNATGVLVVNNAFGKTHRIEAKKEVIVSAGAINTPYAHALGHRTEGPPRRGGDRVPCRRSRSRGRTSRTTPRASSRGRRRSRWSRTRRSGGRSASSPPPRTGSTAPTS